MTQGSKPPIQNKPLLIGVIIVAIVAATTVATLASRLSMTRDQALARALPLMQSTCAQSCNAHGTTATALQGPQDGPFNQRHNNTKYEFKWQVPGSQQAMIVRVWDNGLWIQTKAWWINEQSDKPW